ncbi:gamma-glutamyltransferase [Lutimaribacter sp. EGI FJ00015]|uniref:Gamma-glutamyltransferase n=1 Tax=Lutimaribacter degradans TaxID=2945989 RepID=A0ACC5ZTF5_9RHOB|nr:gamma-glutamyltransferase [Lutimaribacter sp. EGI FJ00013]MCM2561619.1 gamma-glutamyltransferase [Lutimaribacter sp. EGI FJ00013]MCO0612670.1 gamma-glutamyltransferase [Lutimaribacter sp. EGI FJ00015]MCO0635328.1 gamma-glutamyltransferase [Lutimaribacter sp. EGI FJ00014]
MRGVILSLVLGLSAGMACAQEAADSVAPEAGGAGVVVTSDAVAAAQAAKAAGQPVQAREWMVAVANPLAAEAGARVLRTGGTAADAMVAVQAVLGLVEPQSSGLGGGAFLVWYDGATGEVTTLDGRETAPLAATPRLFQDDAGEPLGFFEAVVGGRSVGVPGTPALMETAHRRWGGVNWGSLFDEAIALAEGGFAVSPRLAASVARDAERLASHPVTADYFLPGGTPIAEGDRLQNRDYADVLRRIATEGAEVMYHGEIAADIVRAVREAANPGVLSALDLAIYAVRSRAAVCVPYRDTQVCGMGPPSSGGLTVGQILGMLNGHDLPGPDSAEAWRLIGDASRLAFADRGLYMADSDFVPVPVKGLIAADYLARRGALLTGDDALPEVAPGAPEFDHAWKYGPGADMAQPATSHISISDTYGNALSMTTTIENGFGSRVMVRGFLLNNELTDFSFRSHRDGRPVANAVAPGKRPRSSMAPTIVLRDGKPVLVVGSPGGSRIIGFVAKTIIAFVDWGLDVQQAVDLPHLVNRFGTFDLEEGTEAEALAGPLRALGYEVAIGGLNSGLHAISIGPDGLRGGADTRREGVALGE